ncbi:hypothetical protein BD769DRAFT_1465686, partial [Suillus cothurnatus]
MLNTCLLVRVQFLQSLLATIMCWTIYLEAHHHLLPLQMPIKNLLSYEDENEEMTSHSSSGSCRYFLGSTTHTEAESANI